MDGIRSTAMQICWFSDCWLSDCWLSDNNADAEFAFLWACVLCRHSRQEAGCTRMNARWQNLCVPIQCEINIYLIGTCLGEFVHLTPSAARYKCTFRENPWLAVANAELRTAHTKTGSPVECYHRVSQKPIQCSSKSRAIVFTRAAHPPFDLWFV